MFIILISSSFILHWSLEFFIDGLGQLLVASCKNLPIGHQIHEEQNEYASYRNQGKDEEQRKLAHHFFKNYLKCIKY